MSEPKWITEAARLKQSGVPWGQKLSDALYEAIDERHHPDKIRAALRRRGIGATRDIDLHEEILKHLRREALTPEELSEKLDRSVKSIRLVIAELQDQGYGIMEQVDHKWCFINVPQEENKVYKHEWRGQILRFGVVSDTHLCSKYSRLDLLSEFYDVVQAEGIDTVYHAGDILDGEDVYPGHRYEIDVIGSDAQVDFCVQNYPKREGVKTRFITGNHDLKYFKSQGRDVGKAIAQEREDMEYLGQLGAYVNITDSLRMYLLHPDGGPAYAHSYKPQRIAAGFFGGEKPAIMLLGHYHQIEVLYERNIWIAQCGSWQSQTPYLKRKGIWPKIGGWIVEAGITQEGERGDCVSSFTPTLKVHVI